MLKFIAGVAFGALMSFLYVNYNVQLPAYLQLPEILRGNLISTATESTLYDLDAQEQEKARALEVYFANRAQDAAKIDAAFGHPLLAALHKERASRYARQLSLAWSGFDKALAQDALRQRLEAKHGTSDTQMLKQAMLMEAFDRKPFLKRWLEKTSGPVTAENLRALLRLASAYPAVLPDESE